MKGGGGIKRIMGSKVPYGANLPKHISPTSHCKSYILLYSRVGFGFQMFIFLLKVVGFMKVLRENLPGYVFTVVRPRPDIYELAFDRT